MTTTPGPWTIHWTGHNVVQTGKPNVQKGDRPHVVRWEEGQPKNHYMYQIASPWTNKNHMEHMEANARLIAAAPEMLSLIAALADSDYARLHHGDLSHAARALLARIEGKE